MRPPFLIMEKKDMYAQNNSENQPFALCIPPPPSPPHGHPFQALWGRDGQTRVTYNTTYHALLERMLMDIAKRI